MCCMLRRDPKRREFVEAMSGDGTVDCTVMHIIDPAGGRQYQEGFRTFFTKYEGAFRQVSGDYFQIRHFR
jgi:hypothetical protein